MAGPTQSSGHLLSPAGLLQYFSGDGYSVTADGQRSGREYVMPNLPLTSIAGGYTFIDLDVTAPSS